MPNYGSTIIRSTRKVAVASTLTLLVFALQMHTANGAVVEFFNPDLDNYFITADPTEQVFVDSGTVGRWFRTGGTFAAGGPNAVCRFYGNGNINPATGSIYGPNSHFYTVDANECAGLKAAYVGNAKSWKFESNDFSTTPTNAGGCAAGLNPVWRSYNNGFSRGIDSNHRITANYAAYKAQVAAGWIGEGIVMCAPWSATAAVPSTFFAVSAMGSASGVSAGTLAHGQFAWTSIGKVRGRYDFTEIDAYVKLAVQAGLIDKLTNTAEVSVTLGLTPPWAVANQGACAAENNGPVRCTIPPDNIKDWTDFLSAVIGHFNGTTQPHIRLYELWNEFNVTRYWTGTDAQMLSLAAAALPIIHQDPYSKLLTPSVAGPVGTVSPASGVTAMTSYLQAGGWRYADGGAFHGYIGAQNGVSPFPMPEDDVTSGCTAGVTCYGSIVTKATQIRAVFDQNGMSGRPIYQTEGSWGNLTITDLPTQIAWASRYWLLQAGLRSTLNLQMAAWFAWATPTFGWGNIEDASGNPTPAGDALTTVYHWVVGATIDQPCTGAANGTYVCTLVRPGGYAAQAVWNTKGSIAYSPPSSATQYRDLSGNTVAIPPGGTVSVGSKPILIESVAPSAKVGAPNIVMILTDDQDVQLDSLSFMPNVKSLIADQGVTLTNFLVPLSLCCPSRSTILRGQFPHNTGVLTNSLPLGGFERAYIDNIESSTVATLLHGAGYRTVLFGKYLNGYPNTSTPNYIPPGWDEWYSPYAGNPYGEYNYTLNENGTLVTYGATAADYLTDVISKKAADFITRNAGKPNPLFMYVATYAPHAPYTPAPRHANLFPGLVAPKSAAFNEADVSAKPAYISQRPKLTATQIAAIDTGYRMRAQALQAVDEAVTSIVNALATSGRLANTYIVLVSDNGYHMGQHRLLAGKYTPYETDLHVPMIVRGPGVPAGVVRDQFAGNLDLAPTFADFAGVAPLDFVDGRSLKPLLSSTPPTTWRQSFFLEEFNGGITEPAETDFVAAVKAGENDPSSTVGIREPADADDLLRYAAANARDMEKSTTAVPPIPSYYGFKTAAYKYVEYETGETELYVASDPYELVNVASKVAPSIATTLSKHLETYLGCATDACRRADGAPPPALLSASFTINPSATASGTTISLAATASGTPPYVYTWTGDGDTQIGATATMRLTTPGPRTITLGVKDAIGAEAVVTRTVSISAQDGARPVAGGAQNAR